MFIAYFLQKNVGVLLSAFIEAFEPCYIVLLDR